MKKITTLLAAAGVLGMSAMAHAETGCAPNYYAPQMPSQEQVQAMQKQARALYEQQARAWQAAAEQQRKAYEQHAAQAPSYAVQPYGPANYDAAPFAHNPWQDMASLHQRAMQDMAKMNQQVYRDMTEMNQQIREDIAQVPAPGMVGPDFAPAALNPQEIDELFAQRKQEADARFSKALEEMEATRGQYATNYDFPEMPQMPAAYFNDGRYGDMDKRFDTRKAQFEAARKAAEERFTKMREEHKNRALQGYKGRCET